LSDADKPPLVAVIATGYAIFSVFLLAEISKIAVLEPPLVNVTDRGLKEKDG
jgi:hypothetical protein